MAKQYKAANTNIKVGLPGDTRAQMRFFNVGDVVTGLPIEMMKELWDAGLLEEVTAPIEVSGPDPVKDEVPSKVASEESQTTPEGGDESKA